MLSVCEQFYRSQIIWIQFSRTYRQTLERAVTYKIPMKKMRTVFKKYLEFEQKYGDDESITKIKMLAASYVQNELNA